LYLKRIKTAQRLPDGVSSFESDPVWDLSVLFDLSSESFL
jgi:hypothetical protein